MTFSITRRRVANANLLEYASKNRNEGLFIDVTIFAGDEICYGNRLILSCYSEYFEGLFRMSWQNSYEIEDVDGAAMKALIDFIYTGSITINDQNVQKLLLGAKYLKLGEVEQFCDEILHKFRKAILQDYFAHFKAASLNKEVEMKDEGRKYVSTHLDEITQSDEFKELSKDDLVSCISNMERSQATEISIYQAMITWVRHNEEARKTEFFELFKLINLNDIAKNFIENSILKENLVASNLKCKYQVISTVCNLNINEMSKPLETHLIRLGGKTERKKVDVVFSEFQNTQQECISFDAGLDCHCSLKLNDHIFTMGGNCSTRDDDLKNTTNEVLKFNLKHNTTTWERVAPMNKKRYAMGASVYGDSLFVAGGADHKKQKVRASCEYYLPARDEWKPAPKLKKNSYGLALVSCDGCLYALGGSDINSNYFSSAEKLTSLDGEWQNIQPMQAKRKWLAAVNCNEVVYAIGGQSGKEYSARLKSVEKYDSAENQWEYVSDMKIARFAHAACVMRGKIYVVGGIGIDGNVVKEIECYDPVNNIWSIVENAVDNSFCHSLVAV